jgi:hypothetical protein
VENPEGKKLLGKPRRGWKVNINIYLKEKEGMPRPGQEQWLNVVNMVTNLRVP